MEFLAGALMAGAATLFSIHAIARRGVMGRKVVSANVLVFLQMVLASLTAFAFASFWSGWQTPFRDAPVLFWTGIIGGGLINYPIQYANAKASSFAEASLVAPIQALTPGLVTVAAWLPWIGERPTKQALIGIALISVCNYIHGREDATTLREYLQPFTFLMLPANFRGMSEKKQAEAQSRATGLRWAYLSAVCGTVGLIFDGLIARNGNAILGIGWKWAAVALCAAPGFLQGREEAFTSLAAIRRREDARLAEGAIALAGTSVGAGELLTAVAFRIAPVASVGSMKRLTIPLTVLIAWWILREKKARRRIWPALGVALGAILLAFDSGIGAIIQHLERSISR